MHAIDESFRYIEVRELPRLKLFERKVLRWSSDGAVLDVFMFVNSQALEVFELCLVDGERKWATQTIPIRWTKCNFGGLRPWFSCRAQNSNRHVVKLYWADGRFVCRHCLGFAYLSQRQNPGVRAARRAERIRARLGGTAAEPFRVKPRGMHWRTYRRLCEEAETAEAVADNWLLATLK
jgi:hypothetical protein